MMKGCKKEKEYAVGMRICSDPHNPYKKIIKYRIVEKNTGLFINDVWFFDENDANMMCDFLNNELGKKVDEKLERMFHCGEIELPFDFLKEWDNFNEKAIIERFSRWNTMKNKYRGFKVTCHFKSDLLVLSNVPSDLSPILVCNILNLPYETHFGAGTFCSEDIILNVSKVKEDG